MPLYAHAIEFQPACIPSMSSVRELASFKGTTTEAGFSAGKALYSRSRGTHSWTVPAATRGEYEEVLYLWSASQGGARYMTFMPPNEEAPVRVRFRNLQARAQAHGFWSLEIELEEVL